MLLHFTAGGHLAHDLLPLPNQFCFVLPVSTSDNDPVFNVAPGSLFLNSLLDLRLHIMLCLENGCVAVSLRCRVQTVLLNVVVLFCTSCLYRDWGVSWNYFRVLLWCWVWSFVLLCVCVCVCVCVGARVFRQTKCIWFMSCIVYFVIKFLFIIHLILACLLKIYPRVPSVGWASFIQKIACFRHILIWNCFKFMLHFTVCWIRIESSITLTPPDCRYLKCER